MFGFRTARVGEATLVPAPAATACANATCSLVACPDVRLPRLRLRWKNVAVNALRITATCKSNQVLNFQLRLNIALADGL